MSSLLARQRQPLAGPRRSLVQFLTNETVVHANSLALIALLVTGPAAAGEGMWTPDNLPKAQLERQYNFIPDSHWISHASKAAVQIVGTCSASFISPAGLVLTNHHCARPCIQQLSTATRDFVQTGFYAKDEAAEIKCPDMELNRLDLITDVTERVKHATRGKSGEAYSDAERAVKSSIERECVGGASETVRCDVVSLYHGGVYDTYKYHRYQDVRLVFAPEEAIAFFGGDPDNFNFPRFDLDMTLLRAYEHGKPAHVTDYFRISKEGAAENELTIAIGNPAYTHRQRTVAYLESIRDDALTFELLLLSELRGILEEFRSQGPEQSRIATSELLGIENSYKAFKGELEALRDSEAFASKRKEEEDLRDFVKSDPARQEKYGAAWDSIAKALATDRSFENRRQFIEAEEGFRTEYFRYARALVRGAAERAKPDAERLREYTTAQIPAVEQDLLSSAPIYPELEKVKLVFGLTKLREWLGVDDPLVKQVLGKDSPEVLASRYIERTKLGDPAVRKALWNDKGDAVARSDDPFIVLARAVEPSARVLRQRFDNEFKAIVEKNSELIAAARFERDGTGVYPDATFTQRFSFGEVKGWTENEHFVKPFTSISGAFARATGSEPFALPKSWLDAQPVLAMDQPFNFVTTNDTIGGNSGSPVINRKGEIVGLMFDINLGALGGDFFFDERVNRTVAVHSGAILEALHSVYKADRLVAEMESARGP
jgi:hypothetical protein